jgi:hypothetical protein
MAQGLGFKMHVHAADMGRSGQETPPSKRGGRPESRRAHRRSGPVCIRGSVCHDLRTKRVRRGLQQGTRQRPMPRQGRNGPGCEAHRRDSRRDARRRTRIERRARLALQRAGQTCGYRTSVPRLVRAMACRRSSGCSSSTGQDKLRACAPIIASKRLEPVPPPASRPSTLLRLAALLPSRS